MPMPGVTFLSLVHEGLPGDRDCLGARARLGRDPLRPEDAARDRDADGRRTGARLSRYKFRPRASRCATCCCCTIPRSCAARRAPRRSSQGLEAFEAFHAELPAAAWRVERSAAANTDVDVGARPRRRHAVTDWPFAEVKSSSDYIVDVAGLEQHRDRRDGAVGERHRRGPSARSARPAAAPHAPSVRPTAHATLERVVRESPRDPRDPRAPHRVAGPRRGRAAGRPRRAATAWPRTASRGPRALDLRVARRRRSTGCA